MKNILFKDDLIKEYSTKNGMIVDFKSSNVLTDASIVISERNQKILNALSDFNIGLENQLNHNGQFFEVSSTESRLISEMLYSILENTIVDFVKYPKDILGRITYSQLGIVDIKKSRESIFIDFIVEDIENAYKKLKKMKNLTVNTANDYFQTTKYIGFSCYNMNNRIQLVIYSNEDEYSKDLISSIVQYLHQKDDGYEVRAIIGHTQNKVKSIDLSKQTSMLISGGTGTGKTKELESILLSTLILNKDKYIKITTAGIQKNDGDIYNTFDFSKNSKVNIINEKDSNKVLNDLLTDIEYRKSLLKKHNVTSWIDYLNSEGSDDSKLPFSIYAFDEFSKICNSQSDIFIKIIEEVLRSCRGLGIFIILSTHNVNQLNNNLLANINYKIISLGGYIHKPSFYKLLGTNIDLDALLNRTSIGGLDISDRIFYTSSGEYLKTLLFKNDINYCILLNNYLNN